VSRTQVLSNTVRPRARPRAPRAAPAGAARPLSAVCARRPAPAPRARARRARRAPRAQTVPHSCRSWGAGPAARSADKVHSLDVPSFRSDLFRVPSLTVYAVPCTALRTVSLSGLRALSVQGTLPRSPRHMKPLQPPFEPPSRAQAHSAMLSVPPRDAGRARDSGRRPPPYTSKSGGGVSPSSDSSRTVELARRRLGEP